MTKFSFNPIKVLFLLVVEDVLRDYTPAFNPIKVLFLPMYEKDILSVHPLSILSRFYFYT